MRVAIITLFVGGCWAGIPRGDECLVRSNCLGPDYQRIEFLQHSALVSNAQGSAKGSPHTTVLLNSIKSPAAASSSAALFSQQADESEARSLQQRQQLQQQQQQQQQQHKHHQKETEQFPRRSYGDLQGRLPNTQFAQPGVAQRQPQLQARQTGIIQQPPWGSQDVFRDHQDPHIGPQGMAREQPQAQLPQQRAVQRMLTKSQLLFPKGGRKICIGRQAHDEVDCHTHTGSKVPTLGREKHAKEALRNVAWARQELGRSRTLESVTVPTFMVSLHQIEYVQCVCVVSFLIYAILRSLRNTQALCVTPQDVEPATTSQSVDTLIAESSAETRLPVVWTSWLKPHSCSRLLLPLSGLQARTWGGMVAGTVDIDVFTSAGVPVLYAALGPLAVGRRLVEVSARTQNREVLASVTSSMQVHGLDDVRIGRLEICDGNAVVFFDASDVPVLCISPGSSDFNGSIAILPSEKEVATVTESEGCWPRLCTLGQPRSIAC